MRPTSTTRTTARTAARSGGGLVLAVAAAVVLSGCSGTSDTDPTATTTETVTATPSATETVPAPSATPTDTAGTGAGATPTCGPSDATAAARTAVADLPLPAGLESASWDTANLGTTAYDGCAALSAVTVSVVDATASSPVAVLLFHDGTYLGTATKEQYAFVPDVTRTADDAVRVVYRYAEPQDPNAAPSGRATATYTWDAAAERVDMSGDVPPAQ